MSATTRGTSKNLNKRQVTFPLNTSVIWWIQNHIAKNEFVSALYDIVVASYDGMCALKRHGPSDTNTPKSKNGPTLVNNFGS